MEKNSPPNSNHSIEAEQSVIGGLMLKNDALPDVSNVLFSDDFYEKRHQLLFKAIQNLASQGQPFDPVTLSEQLQKDNTLNAIGGGEYLGTLVIQARKDAPDNIITHARMVKDSQANGTKTQPALLIPPKTQPTAAERLFLNAIREGHNTLATIALKIGKTRDSVKGLGKRLKKKGLVTADANGIYSLVGFDTKTNTTDTTDTTDTIDINKRGQNNLTPSQSSKNNGLPIEKGGGQGVKGV